MVMVVGLWGSFLPYTRQCVASHFGDLRFCGGTSGAATRMGMHLSKNSFASSCFIKLGFWVIPHLQTGF